MTAHPIDTEALRRLADAATVEPPWKDAGEWQTDGYAEYVVVSCEQDSDGEYDHVAEAANERLGAFIAASDPNTVRALLDALSAAEHRATRAEAQSAIRGRAVAVYRERAREAEAERDAARKQYDEDIAYWIAATDAAEARIKAARDVLDQAHDEFEQPDEADIRRALDA